METKTLLIDADLGDLELLGRAFRARKLRTVTAPTAGEAIAVLKSVKATAVAAITFDSDLPDMAAVEFLRAVRAIPGHAATPAIVATDAPDVARLRVLVELGVWEFVLKAPGWAERVVSGLYSGRRLNRR